MTDNRLLINADLEPASAVPSLRDGAPRDMTMEPLHWTQENASSFGSQSYVNPPDVGRR